VAETADPRRRDYFKPDFFNGIGQIQSLDRGRADDRFQSGRSMARSA
jgi:hypothetical protein